MAFSPPHRKLMVAQRVSDVGFRAMEPNLLPSVKFIKAPLPSGMEVGWVTQRYPRRNLLETSKRFPLTKQVYS